MFTYLSNGPEGKIRVVLSVEIRKVLKGNKRINKVPKFMLRTSDFG